MTTVSYVNNVVVTGAFNAINLGAGVNAYIAQGVHISASGTGHAGITGPGGSTVTIAGDVFGDGYGMYLTGLTKNYILVMDHASVASENFAVIDQGNDSVISNAGTISGYRAVWAMGNSPDVHNFGLIHGGHDGVIFDALGGTNLLTNDGTIDAQIAVGGSAASDYVLNTGLITGTVVLNAGADLFDTRGGTMQGTVYLGDGNDTAFGGEGADSIDGGNDLDRLRGKQDDDRLDGGLGNDKLTGGQGEDEFYFSTTLGNTNIDTITDFTHGEDTILLSSSIFAALGSDVSSGEFLSRAHGHGAFNTDQHIIYDNSKGTLWYDVDGHGGTQAVKFAQLGSTDDHPTNLNYHDFAIV